MLFRQDAFLKSCQGTVTAVNDGGGILLDRTVFYATAGGQPCDKGVMEIEGRSIPVANRL
jgi:misacylated tRNA(Ala) deacylase